MQRPVHLVLSRCGRNYSNHRGTVHWIGHKQSSSRMAHLVRYGNRARTLEMLEVHGTLKRKKLNYCLQQKPEVHFFRTHLIPHQAISQNSNILARQEGRNLSIRSGEKDSRDIGNTTTKVNEEVDEERAQDLGMIRQYGLLNVPRRLGKNNRDWRVGIQNLEISARWEGRLTPD